MDAGFLNVLHDAGDDDVFSIAEGVDVDFNCVLEKVIDQDRALRESKAVDVGEANFEEINACVDCFPQSF